jgi:hypothetical protein
VEQRIRRDESRGEKIRGGGERRKIEKAQKGTV